MSNWEPPDLHDTAPIHGEDFSGNPNYQQWAPYVSQVEQKNGIPSGLLVNTIGHESSWRPSIVNPDSGATGFGQFMPDTAKQFGIDPTDPKQSIDAMGEYYKQLIAQNNGDIKKAVAQYGGFKTKDPSDYQSRVIPQYIMAGMQNQQQNPAPPISQTASSSQEWTPPDLHEQEWVPPDLEQSQDRGEFNKGVRRSIAETANLMENAIPAFGKSWANELFGTNFSNKQDLQDYAQKSEDINKEYPAKVGAMTDIKSPSDVIPFLAGSLGENVAGLIPITGEAYVGAKLLAPAMTGMAEEAASKYMAKGFLEDAAKAKAEQEISAKAATLSVLGAMAPQQMAGEYVNLMSKGHDDPMGAALIGGLETGIYALPGMEIMNKVFAGPAAAEAATKTVADAVGAETRTLEAQTKFQEFQSKLGKLKNHPAVQDAMKTAGYLGATGMAAESIGVLGEGVLGANPDIFSADNFARIVNAGVSQAVGGALIGGTVGLAHGPRPDMADFMNLPGANKEEGVKRTTLDTGEVKAGKKTAAEPAQTEANLVTPEGVPVDRANPITTNLTDPSILRPAQMTDTHHALADKFKVATEDLRFATEPYKTDAEKTAALDQLFSTLNPTIDPRQEELPSLDFEGRVQALMKSNPLLSEDRDSAVKMIQQADARRAVKRDAELQQEGAKFEKNGTVTRQITPESIKDRPAWLQNPEGKIGVYDPIGAAEAHQDYMHSLGKEDLIHFISNRWKPLTYEAKRVLAKAENGYISPTLHKTLLKIARDNGIPTSDKTTPEQIVKGLNAKRIAQAQDGLTADTQRTSPRQAAIDALQRKHDANEEMISKLKENFPNLSKELERQNQNIRNEIRGLDRLPDAQLQKPELPVTGNLHSDVVQPIRVARNLSFIKLKDEAKPVLNNIIREMERITKQVSGSAARFVPVRHLLEDHSANPVLGAQLLNVVMTAMPDYYASHPMTKNGFIPNQLVETTYHENAHFLYNKIFSDAERGVIRKDAEKLRPYFMQDGYLKEQDFDAFLSSPEGLDELFANAVGKEGAKRYLRQENQMQGFPFSLRGLAKRIMDWTDKTRAAVRSLIGRQTLEDLMNSTLDGKYSKDHIQDAMSEVQRARVNEIASHLQRANQVENEASMDEAMAQASGPYNGLEKAEKSRNSFNGNRETNPKSMGLVGKFISSFRYLADKYDFITPAYNDFKEAQMRGQAFMQGFSQHLNTGFNQLPKEDRYLVHSIMDAVSSAEGKIRFNPEGHALIPYDSSSFKDLPFDHANLKDGDVVPLKDPDLAKGLKSMQDAYKFALDQKEQYWREYVAKSFAEEGLPQNFSKSDIEAAKAKLDIEDPNFKKKLDTLESVAEDLDGLTKMRRYEYTPRQRYGQYAYVVKHRATKENLENGKAGTTAALHTVENGFFNRQFDNHSLSKAQGSLKKYLDRPDLYNVYDTRGRITKDKVSGNYRPISNPFILTHDNIKKHYGLTGDNLSIMSGLLNSRDIDMNKYNQLRDLLTTQINHDKFSRMFKSSEKIDGYSKDWDRVIHSYATTSAHFLGNMEFNRNLPEYQKIYSKVENDGLRERLQNHFGKPGERGYINSGSSDYGTLRAVNYLWCMGANPSSLLVESLKIPTVTLGTLNQFRPNVLKNMGTLGKYAGRYYTALNKIVGNRSQFGGHLVTPLTNDAFLDHICQGDKEMKAFIKEKAANYNNIAEASSNRTFGGGDIFGSETGKSAFQSKTNKVQTWLSNPLSVVEQGNRLISFCANYEAMRELEQSNPGRLDKILQKNQIYQDLRQRNPDWKPWQAGTMYAVDEENGAPGKIDRSPYLQGAGGAFVIPFFSFDQTALEGIVKMFNRGADGKKALGVMMGAFALTAGIMGLPGARLLTKGGQALQNAVQGTDYDWQQAMRESMAPAIGARNSLMVTNGLLRAYGGMEISQRISLPLPGEEMLMNLLGIEAGKTSDILGVEGSMIENAANSWRAYMNGQSAGASLGQMLPNSLANISKAYQLTQRGAMNNVGGNATRAIPPDQLSTWSVIARALGMTSDQIASANEQIYAQKMKGKELETADHRFTQQAAMAFMMQQDAMRRGNSDAAKDYHEKLMEVLQKKADFAAHHGVPYNGASFMNQLRQSAIQRQMPLVPTRSSLGGKPGMFNGSIGTYQYYTNLRGDK